MKRLIQKCAGSLATGAMVILAGCSKKETPAEGLAPLASASAPRATPQARGTQDSKDAKRLQFVILPDSKIALDMPAPKEHIKADIPRAGGNLDVDLTDLAATRGDVKVDLTTLATHTFGSSKDVDQTNHARTWLEVGEAVDGPTRESFRWATFTLRGLEGLAESQLAKVALAKDDVGPFRQVECTVRGDLVLHGRKAEKTAPVQVRFRYASDASGVSESSSPTSFEITSKAPFSVNLREHDVKPRDTFGKFAQASLGLFGTKVAETASVTLQLRAKLKD